MRELCVAQALPEALRTEGPSTPQFEEEEQLPLACGTRLDGYTDRACPGLDAGPSRQLRRSHTPLGGFPQHQGLERHGSTIENGI